MSASLLQPARLARLMVEAVDRCRLQLTGRTVVTEAASGAYACTAALAALAGAQVTALVRPSGYGSVEQVRSWTERVAGAAGVADRVDVVEALTPQLLAAADVVTNSGHLRPLDAALVDQLSPTAVVPLMMEAWEIGAGRVDVDLAALRRRGIATAGTAERNPAVGVFDYLGAMALKLLLDAGVPVVGSDLVLLCDNAFHEYVEGTLRACGAKVTSLCDPAQLAGAGAADAVVVSLTPADGPRVTARHLADLARRSPGAVVVQLFGDVDRTAAAALDVPCWPDPPPAHGHMGLLPSGIGPEPVVRLQAGGLKVAQVLLTPVAQRTAFDLAFVDELPAP